MEREKCLREPRKQTRCATGPARKRSIKSCCRGAFFVARLTRGLGGYGLGFVVEDLGDRTRFGHSGGNEGFRAPLYGIRAPDRAWCR
jgi:hypothetical protein